MNTCSRVLTVFSLSGLFSAAMAATDFTKDVMPIFEKSCIKCHSVKPENKLKGKFAVDDMEKLAKKIAAKDVIVAGDPDKSKMIEVVKLPQSEEDAMPPKTKGDPLTAEQIGVLSSWIKEGALLPGSAAAPATTGKTTTTATTPAAGPMKWTNTEGKTIEAEFGGLEGGNVILIMGGKKIPVALTKLDAASQAQAKKAGGK